MRLVKCHAQIDPKKLQTCCRATLGQSLRDTLSYHAAQLTVRHLLDRNGETLREKCELLG